MFIRETVADGDRGSLPSEPRHAVKVAVVVPNASP